MRPTDFTPERRLAGVHSSLLDPMLETLQMHASHATPARTRVKHPLAALATSHRFLFTDSALNGTVISFGWVASLGWVPSSAATWRTPFGIEEFDGQCGNKVGTLHDE